MPAPSPSPGSAAPVPPAAARERARFTVRARLHSFVYAFRGMAVLLRTQHNAWIHAAAALAATALGLALGLSPVEWCLVILAMALVLSAEALNTAVEFLADEVSAAPRELIGKAKDLGAAAVLFSSLGAAAVGLLIFGPRLVRLAERQYQTRTAQPLTNMVILGKTQ